jgi:hypothetical protein
MSIFRSVLLIGIISLLVSLGLFFLGSMMGYDEFKGGYAVLITDSSVDDRIIVSLLTEQSGFENSFTGKPVSESSQWVMLDNFASLETVPLDKYFSRVNYFDPRNDGYAEKLKAVFVKDDKRFVYIPLSAGNWNPTILNQQFASVLADIPFSVDYYGIGRPLFFFFIMYALSSVCLFVICCVKKKSHYRFNIISLVPVFFSLAFFGAAGIGCAALIFAFFILLKEPIAELAALTSSYSKDKSQLIARIKKEIVSPYKYYLFLLPVFAAAFAIMIVFSQLKLLYLIAVFAAAVFVYFFSFKILLFSGGKRKRFIPVMIIKRRLPEFVFSFYMLPFVIAAFFTLFLSPYQAGSYVSDNKFDVFVDRQDYYAHLTYQSSFSTRQFGSSSLSFPSFFFEADGLPSMKASTVRQTINKYDFPPFPYQLERLMDFFHSVNSGQKTNTGFSGVGNIAETLSLLVLLLFVLPGFFIKRKNDYSLKVDFSEFRRINRVFRSADINWNKSMLYNYNERNQKRSKTGTFAQRPFGSRAKLDSLKEA